MRLRHGVTVEQAISALDEVIRRSNDPRTFGLHEVESKLNQYLTWVNAPQVQFRAVFADTELEDLVLSRGYWHLATATIPSYPRELGRLIDDELIFQAGYPGVPGDRGGRLGEVASRLRTLRRIAGRVGEICVPDTNALMHYTRFDRLDWRARLKMDTVRLVIPLAVVDELDGKKYARRDEFQQRAGELLTLIDRYETSAPDAYVELREGVTFEVLPDEEGHVRALGTDQEILARCEFLHQVTGLGARLITGDSGARINARARGIDVYKLPVEELLPRFGVAESGA